MARANLKPIRALVTTLEACATGRHAFCAMYVPQLAFSEDERYRYLCDCPCHHTRASLEALERAQPKPSEAEPAEPPAVASWRGEPGAPGWEDGYAWCERCSGTRRMNDRGQCVVCRAPIATEDSEVTS